MVLRSATPVVTDVPRDLTGRRVVVTGANSGVGYETAHVLAARGAEVVLAVRHPDRGEDAADRIREALPGAAVSVASCDLADLESVRAFAASQTQPLDLLINNAAVMATPPELTVDGAELQFGINHLGHFALTGLLLPQLLGAAAPRVVTVSSVVAYFSPSASPGDPMDVPVRPYRKWSAYSGSKLANLLFTTELDRRIRAAGLSLIAVAAHPGYARTNLYGNMGRMLTLVVGRSARSGAEPILYAATSPDVRGAGFYGPRGRLRRTGVRPLRMPSRAWDITAAEALWQLSADRTGVPFHLGSNSESAGSAP